MQKEYYIYIISNKTGSTIYTGICNNLQRRVWEHKNKQNIGFTSRYNVNKLLYYESFSSPQDAIAREKEIKGWLRKKKMELIKSLNPSYNDLSEDWK